MSFNPSQLVSKQLNDLKGKVKIGKPAGPMIPGGVIGDIIGVIGAPQNLLTKAIGLATGGIGAILAPVIGIIDNKVEILRSLRS